MEFFVRKQVGKKRGRGGGKEWKTMAVFEQMKRSKDVAHVPSKACLFADLDDDVLTWIVSCIHVGNRGRLACSSRQFADLVRRLAMRDLGLVPEQFDCFLDAMMGKNVFVTGAAGSGKSHLLKLIVSHLPNVLSTASTGCAAAVLGAFTFHSVCGLGVSRSVSASSIVDRLILHDRSRCGPLRNMDTLVVDEAGMLTGELFDKASEVVRGVRGVKPHWRGKPTDAPFGGVQLILCGDVMQLPPIEANGRLTWIFEAGCWERLQFKVHALQHAHRQIGDSHFHSVLSRSRVGTATASDLEYLQRNSSQDPIHDAIKLFARNLPAEMENDRRLLELEGRMHRFDAIDCSTNPNTDVEELRRRLESCAAPKMLYLKIGARVMCLKNIVDGVLVNGSLGTVTDVYPSRNAHGRLVQVHVVVQFDAKDGEAPHTHTFSTHVRGRELNPNIVFYVQSSATRSGRVDNTKAAQRIQLPLKLAWAISIHKSQGMTLDKVEIDFKNTFSYGQAYTALSRVKTLEKAHIKNLALSHLNMVNKKTLAFVNR